MKSFYILCLVMATTAHCYGQFSFPRSTSDVIRQASEIKQTVDQHKQQKKQEERRQREDQYAYNDLQDQVQQLRDSLSIYRIRYKSSLVEVEKAHLSVENANTLLRQAEYNQAALERQLDANKLLIDSLQRRNAVLEDDLINTSSALAEKTSETVKKTEKQPKINLGSVTVYGDKAPDMHRTEVTRRSQQVYHTGPRGGCFYYTSSGRKEYVDRSYCR